MKCLNLLALNKCTNPRIKAKSLEIDEKLTAVKKVIELLNGNGEIEFTKEEVTRLNQGFIGDTLNKYNITLPQEVDVAVMPAGNNVSTL